MRIKTIFESEEQLTRYMGESFVLMMHRLHDAYEHRKCNLSISSLRAATMAFVFYGAAVKGNKEDALHFDCLLRGLGPDAMEFGNEYVRVSDEHSVTFVWDLAALMLDSGESQSAIAQWAYDEVDHHVYLAYKLSQPGVSETVPAKLPTSTATPQPASAPASSPLPNSLFTVGHYRQIISLANRTSDKNFVASAVKMINMLILEAHYPELVPDMQKLTFMHSDQPEPLPQVNYNYNAPIANQIQNVKSLESNHLDNHSTDKRKPETDNDNLNNTKP